LHRGKNSEINSRFIPANSALLRQALRCSFAVRLCTAQSATQAFLAVHLFASV
jgi:hypothetical protein